MTEQGGLALSYSIQGSVTITDRFVANAEVLRQLGIAGAVAGGGGHLLFMTLNEATGGTTSGSNSSSSVNWSDHLDSLGTDALGGSRPTSPFPGTDYTTHAHHIVMRNGIGEAAREAVQESQAILRRYNIDPYLGRENLAWAPNWGHPDQYALDVLAALRRADQNVGTRQAIINTLRRMARDYIAGRWRP
jgi:hypothetical protein